MTQDVSTGPTRRRLLGTLGAALLAQPKLLQAQETPLRDLVPGWMKVRLAVPNDPQGPGRYADYGQIARHGHRFVSENLTKTGFAVTAADPVEVDLSRFRAQANALAQAGNFDNPAFDLHGAFWHQSLSEPLQARLAEVPREWSDLLEQIYDGYLAAYPFPRIDINEVARGTAVERENDYWRGPYDRVKNGSLWYQAAETAPGDWRHGPGYWWLHAAQKAATGSAEVIFQDFDLEAGRPWGTTADSSVPDGLEARTDEMLKRRRLLDAMNYALVHGGRIDTFGFQAHLRTKRAIDRRDLTLFLSSLGGMGIGVEVTELDVFDHDGTLDAAAYTAHVLGLLFDKSPLAQVGIWTGWAPKDQPVRVTALDRAGLTSVGHAIVAAAGAAAPPEARAPAPVGRFYQLCFGVTKDTWRAARNRDAPGFEIDGNSDGTRVRPGSGGAALPLTNRTARPGGAVAPVWRTAGGALQDYDPAAMALVFQWVQRGAPMAPILTLLSQTEAQIFALTISNGTLHVGAEKLSGQIPDGPATVALRWSDGVLRMLSSIGSPAMEVPLPDRPDQIVLLGNGSSAAPLRATCLTLLRDPPDDDGLASLASPIGADLSSVDTIRAAFG